MMKTKSLLTYSFAFITIIFNMAVFADQTIINNCNPNVTTDPRVPPAGAYNVKNGDGSSNQIYTTGETKPYIVDNNCNSSAQTAQPYVFVNPRSRR